MTWLLMLLAAALAWPLRAELVAAWRVGRRALCALALAALIFAVQLHRHLCPPPDQDKGVANLPPPCPSTPRPHEVDHAPPYMLDPLPAVLAPDLGSGLPAGDVDARVRALDERARSRGR